MNGKIHGLYTMMIHIARKKGTAVYHRRFSCLLLTSALLLALSSCGSNASKFPPTEEAVQTAAEKLAALTALVLDAPVFLVCLSMQAENLCKFPLGLVRFHSRRWINDITREGAQE